MTRPQPRTPDAPKLHVDYCTARAAKFACETWHYSGSTPNIKVVRFGVWEDGAFKGCLLFNGGATPNLAKPFGLPQIHVAELVRIAMKAHHWPISRVMRIALGMIRARSPGLRVIISFADEAQSHHGGVYQASGWTYLGRRQPRSYFVANGRMAHPRSFGTFGANPDAKGRQTIAWVRANVDPAAFEVRAGGKYKYAIGLDRGAKRLIASMRDPATPTRDGLLPPPIDAPPEELSRIIGSLITTGHPSPSYIAAEALAHLTGGSPRVVVPAVGRAHWFVVTPDGAVLDPHGDVDRSGSVAGVFPGAVPSPPARDAIATARQIVAGEIEPEPPPIPDGAELARVSAAIVRSLTPALLKPKYRAMVIEGADPMTGHCYVATEALFHMMGRGQPRFVRHEGEPHWFLDIDGRVVDLTAAQFKTTPPYAGARRQAFLTKKPSKRAVVVITAARDLL